MQRGRPPERENHSHSVRFLISQELAEVQKAEPENNVPSPPPRRKLFHWRRWLHPHPILAYSFSAHIRKCKIYCSAEEKERKVTLKFRVEDLRPVSRRRREREKRRSNWCTQVGRGEKKCESADYSPIPLAAGSSSSSIRGNAHSLAIVEIAFSPSSGARALSATGIASWGAHNEQKFRGDNRSRN